MKLTEAVFENISERIKQELWKAKKTIHIAVAWFTDIELFNILKNKTQNKCTVFLIINDDEINNCSSIPYDKIQQNQLHIYKIKNKGAELMHNKFCVIDESTVITGSYNWSYKAHSNFENIVIAYNDIILANQFLDEFNKIVRIIKPEVAPINESLPLHIIFKRLEIIKNFISLDDNGSLLAEIEKIREYDFNNEILEIIDSIESDNKKNALQIIERFLGYSNQINIWIDNELVTLKTELRKLENQINAFDNEKTEIRKIISEFNHRHTLELGDITLKILDLKKYKFVKLTKNFNKAEENEKQYREQFELETSKKINMLNETEKNVLKSKFRRATVLCHPDKVINEFKQTAHKIFIELKTAYDQNDLNRVSEILNDLENGNFLKSTSETVNEKTILQIEISRIRRQLKILQKEIISLKESYLYRKIIGITNWDEYFTKTRHILEKELEYLQNVYKNPTQISKVDNE